MTDIPEQESRRARVVEGLKEAKSDAFLISASPNIRYLSGFTGSNALLLLTRERSILFTDPRYQTQAPLESDCDVKISKRALALEAASWVKRLRLRSVAVEAGRISLELYQSLQEHLKGIQLKTAAAVIEKLRMIKSPSEVEAIRTSVNLNSDALAEALSYFRPDMTESELAAEIDYRMRRLGAERNAFETIVASGPRSALPHAHPEHSAIRANQLLLIDMGASVGGYASDMTRTHAVGKISPQARKMYKAVLESQLAAIDAVRPGVTCATVDRAARNVLKKHSVSGQTMDKQFIHSTGHGLGLEIHEGPRVGRKDKTSLEVGMTVTVEPGAYVAGFCGVRIEDTVVVTTGGCEVLTPTGKELVVL